MTYFCTQEHLFLCHPGAPTLFFNFLKEYFIVYAITVVPIFPLCLPPPSPSPNSTINSHIIVQYLNISHDTIKILEENIGSKISDIEHSNIFANISPTAREIKKK